MRLIDASGIVNLRRFICICNFLSDIIGILRFAGIRNRVFIINPGLLNHYNKNVVEDNVLLNLLPDIWFFYGLWTTRNFWLASAQELKNCVSKKQWPKTNWRYNVILRRQVCRASNPVKQTSLFLHYARSAKHWTQKYTNSSGSKISTKTLMFDVSTKANYSFSTCV